MILHFKNEELFLVIFTIYFINWCKIKYFLLLHSNIKFFWEKKIISLFHVYDRIEMRLSHQPDALNLKCFLYYYYVNMCHTQSLCSYRIHT